MPDALALWQALCSGSGRHLLGLQSFFMRQTVCPKSWIQSRKLRISNSSPESQKKEKDSPPAWFWLRPGVCSASGYAFPAVCGVTEKGKRFSARLVLAASRCLFSIRVAFSAVCGVSEIEICFSARLVLITFKCLAGFLICFPSSSPLSLKAGNCFPCRPVLGTFKSLPGIWVCFSFSAPLSPKLKIVFPAGWYRLHSGICSASGHVIVYLYFTAKIIYILFTFN